LTGGPPVRGTKLQAWHLPPIREKNFSTPEGSVVPQKQEAMFSAIREVLTAIAADVREGLLETVGVESEFSAEDGRCSMILKLPPQADSEMIAQAIALENADAWCDDKKRVHLGINPWFSTKDIDQTVLCAIKVIHVLLGLHAVCEIKPKTFGQKILASLIDVLKAQKEASANKNQTNF